MNTLDRSNTKQICLEQLESSRLRLQNAIRGLEPEVCASAPVEGYWTIKDILGHIVSWNDEFRREIEMILQGQHPGFEYIISFENDYRDWNQQQYERKRGWPWQRILDDLQRDHLEAVALVQRLEPEQYELRGVIPWSPAARERPEEPSPGDTESIETLVSAHGWHAGGHIEAIMRWRSARYG
jgi:uncharacterized damage-inducible protein DinB